MAMASKGLSSSEVSVHQKARETWSTYVNIQYTSSCIEMETVTYHLFLFFFIFVSWSVVRL